MNQVMNIYFIKMHFIIIPFSGYRKFNRLERDRNYHYQHENYVKYCYFVFLFFVPIEYSIITDLHSMVDQQGARLVFVLDPRSLASSDEGGREATGITNRCATTENFFKGNIII